MTKFKRNIIIILINILIVLLIYSLINFRLLWGNHSFKKDYTVGRYQVVYFVNGNFTFNDSNLIVDGKLIISNSKILGRYHFIVRGGGEVHISNSKIASISLHKLAKAFLKDSSVLVIDADEKSYLELIGGRCDEIYAVDNNGIYIKNCQINSINKYILSKVVTYKPKEGINSPWLYNFYHIEDFTKLGSRNYSYWGGIYDFKETDYGLSLPVGAKGSLVYRFEIDKPLKSLYMNIWFAGEENSITVAWENGKKIETISQNKAYKGEVVDLTKYLKNSKFILFNFFAENRGIEQEVILEKIVFYGSYK